MDEKKYIRFVDSGYNTLFHVKNGSTIRLVWPGGVQRELVCKYIDDAHARIGGAAWHMRQFAEEMERNNIAYEPVTEIGDLEFYKKKYYDRDNTGADGKTVPYYSLIERIVNRGASSETITDYAFCLNPAAPEKVFCKLVWENNFGKSSKYFASDIKSLCEDEKLCTRINNIVTSINEVLSKGNLSLSDQIAQAERAQAPMSKLGSSASRHEVEL